MSSCLHVRICSTGSWCVCKAAIRENLLWLWHWIRLIRWINGLFQPFLFIRNLLSLQTCPGDLADLQLPANNHLNISLSPVTPASLALVRKRPRAAPPSPLWCFLIGNSPAETGVSGLPSVEISWISCRSLIAAWSLLSLFRRLGKQPTFYFKFTGDLKGCTARYTDW